MALTKEQVEENDLPVISKPVRYFDAVETEAFAQARIVDTVRARLDELIPEPLDSVLERQEQQRTAVAEQLLGITEGSADGDD